MVPCYLGTREVIRAWPLPEPRRCRQAQGWRCRWRGPEMAAFFCSNPRPMQTARDISGYRKHWAERFGTAPFLPMSREEMELLGSDSCDVIVVTGDAYVDHPSFGMAIIGRVLEAQGFRVGIIDSMVNRYTAERRVRSDDAYTPGGAGGKRPDRSVIVYAQRAREAFRDVPIVVGGI